MQPKPGLNANARRLMLDTAGQQAQHGTETAHGTDHNPAVRQFKVQFNTKGGPVSFIRRSIKTRPTRWSRNGIDNHATNAPKPGLQKRLRQKAAQSKEFAVSRQPTVLTKKNSVHKAKSRKYVQGKKKARLLA